MDPDAAWAGITGRLAVAPVVGVFVYENCAAAAREYARRVAQWDFTTVVPCHFDVRRCGPADVRVAFEFLEEPGAAPALQRALRDPPRALVSGRRDAGDYWPAADVQLLRDVERVLTQGGVIRPNE